jgi:hypothetical protein
MGVFFTPHQLSMHPTAPELRDFRALPARVVFLSLHGCATMTTVRAPPIFSRIIPIAAF